MENLIKMNTTALQKRWIDEFGSKPPRRASREYLLGSLAWQGQAKRLGGLNRAATRQINQLMQQLQDGKALVPQNQLIIKPGTKLLREYQGAKHEVIIAEGGFRYQGDIYGSLSAIARQITGTRWNGKVFFGVKR